MKLTWALITALALGFAGSATAQSGVQLEPGVARASLVHGDVNMQRGDSGDWVAVTANTPVVAGDRVSTGERSRAEVQLDFANVLRLDQNSTAKIATLSRTHMQVQLGQGLANFDVMKGNEADTEIDTPNVAVRPLKEGRYRILVSSDSETQVIVRKGAAEVTTPQGSTRVESGDMITIQGIDQPQYQTASAPQKDDWDNFNNDRDRLISDAESWHRTNRYYTGAQDLDAYGRWEEIPDYGQVWVPVNVDPYWAPYHYGRWVWEPYYGWTWVSYEPWGWAPYHYGRWFLYDSSWVWWPGPVFVGYRPLWAPAYVSFFGFGGHLGFGLGFGFGSIGWLPIGPCDGFYPWYGHRGNVVNVVNVTNITNITNVTNVRNVNGPVSPLFHGRGISNLRLAENNPRLLRGISTMPTENFGKTVVPTHGETITAANFHNAGMVTGQVPVVPTHESLRVTDRAATVPENAGRLENQRFFSKTAPVATTRASFSEQQTRMEKLVSASTPSRATEVTRTAGTEARGSASTNERAGSERAQATVDANAGANRSTSSTESRVEAGRSASQSDTETRAGWHRFGESNSAQSSAGVSNREAAAGARSTTETRSETVSHEPASRPGSQQDSSSSRDSASPSRGAGWHSFSRSSDSGTSHESAPSHGSGKSGPTREEKPQSEAPHGQARGEAGGADSGGWHSFSRSPEASASSERSYGPSRDEVAGGSGSYSRNEGSYNRSEPGYSRSETGSGYGRSTSSSGYSRPPLDLRQPIVTPRSSGSYGSSSHSASSSGSYHSSGSSSHSSSSSSSHSGSSPHSRGR